MRFHSSKAVLQDAFATIHLRVAMIWLLFIATATAAEPATVERGREVGWKQRHDLFVTGLRAAESFRAELLADDEPGWQRINVLGEAVALFPQLAEPQLGDRPSLSRFRIRAEDFARQIQGRDRVDARRTFGQFTGRWYGKWDRMLVDHNWHVVEFLDPPSLVAADLPRLAARQFAWIGDGFGWNYVASAADTRDSTYILGMTYHFDPAQVDQIRIRRPHVGYDAGRGRIVWLTASEVFFEEVLPENPPSAERYAITGFRYRWRGKRLESEGPAFQAIYTRQTEDRPAWWTFPLQLTAGDAAAR